MKRADCLINVLFRFRVVEAWLEAIERLMNETQNVEVSFEQYKATVNKFKVENLLKPYKISFNPML